MIMTTLTMILMKKKYDMEWDNEKQTAAAMVTIHTTEGDVTIDAAEDNDNLFYEAAALTYDHSPMVLPWYFHNDRSKTQPYNKHLWPIRYHTLEEYGI
jgi:hypothetical protein